MIDKIQNTSNRLLEKRIFLNCESVFFQLNVEGQIRIRSDLKNNKNNKSGRNKICRIK